MTRERCTMPRIPHALERERAREKRERERERETEFVKNLTGFQGVARRHRQECNHMGVNGFFGACSE